jgi:hypothetical protein
MFFLLLMALMYIALVLQHYVGAFPGMGGQILLLPLVFFYAAAALPLWAMLTTAFFAGLMWDCMMNLVIDGRTETIFGWSILLYGALGAVMNGLRPMFMRGRWIFLCVVAGLLTSLMVLIEYVVLTFRREPFALIWPEGVWHRVLSSGLFVALASPAVFIVLNWIGRRLGHFEKPRFNN